MNTFRIILFVTFVVLLSACSNKKKCKVSGEILNGEGKTLYFQKLDLDSTYSVDSVVLKANGKFNFSVPRLEYPSFFVLKMSENNFITLLADTTENIEVIADASSLPNSYTVQNSMGSSYVKTLNRKLDVTKEGIDSLVNLYNNTPEEETELRGKLREDMVDVINEQKNFVFDFIMTNPRSFASYYAVFQRFDDETLVLNAYDKRDFNMISAVATSLDLMYPESPRVKQLKNYVLGIRYENQQTALQERLVESAKEVKTIPEIAIENLKGDTVKLSSLKGKMVLLSFWASWDEKSMLENKRLINIYKKYKSKGFEVYAVSLDRSKILWESAVETNKYPWINVSDLQYTNSYPARLYNVKQLPANYLISKKGEIIGKDLFGRILDEKLDDLLN
ncbi:AhpC/TSA family protein [Labilibacter sediminis]|nr:AhpC/TSA family protein [Labilibacter sediminis]